MGCLVVVLFSLLLTIYSVWWSALPWRHSISTSTNIVINKRAIATSFVNTVMPVRTPLVTQPEQSANFTDYVLKLRQDIIKHQALDPYFIPRDHKVNPYNYSFLIDGREMCQGDPPFLLIVVTSVFDHQEERWVIRETWGSVTKTGQWADGTKLPVIKPVFLFGMTSNTNIFGKLENESMEYGDVVLADFVDSYKNLTIKSMSALYWTTRYCPDAKYLLNNDEDTIVHFPRLLHVLNRSLTNSVFGFARQGARVFTGELFKWGVSKKEYPGEVYPPYIYGHHYIIPSNLIGKYLSMEDVFITDIVRRVTGATLQTTQDILMVKR
ncbi:beta-1,3-galactosyltransferase 5-like [Liolophura sinensis]|uniref:beta-1,3-galactosyltransferase 5-like n=1 Tax=Liolophura sinensis TaxID=3198878 RepID=UPI003158999D